MEGIDPLPLMSDQDIISPYNSYTILSRQEIRVKKISTRELVVDPMPNSPN